MESLGVEPLRTPQTAGIMIAPRQQAAKLVEPGLTPTIGKGGTLTH